MLSKRCFRIIYSTMRSETSGTIRYQFSSYFGRRFTCRTCIRILHTSSSLIGYMIREKAANKVILHRKCFVHKPYIPLCYSKYCCAKWIEIALDFKRLVNTRMYVHACLNTIKQYVFLGREKELDF